MFSADNRIARFVISETTVIIMIVINTIAMFFDAFPSINAATRGQLIWIDYVCVIYFIIEAFIKIMISDCEEYWENKWNKFDFFVVLSSTPTLLEPFFDMKIFSVILILRLGRLARFFKLLRFVPEGPKIWCGVQRALKASVAVFLALIMMNLVFGMGATMLFSSVSPEHFGNPLISCYTMFKVFTIEGWYNIPDEIAARPLIGAGISLSIKLYFIIAVIAGGILGLSIANAVFVDEMTSDNNLVLEQMVATLRTELEIFRKENINNRHAANEELKNEIERFKKENMDNRHESNKEILIEIETIKKTLDNLIKK